jgi:hypothetical protein
MPELKPLNPQSIGRCLERAERYRLLNEPVEAESICLDVLEADAQNQKALVMLLLSLTDQFDEGESGVVARAQEVARRLPDAYEQAYYAGIVAERRAKAQLRRGGPGSSYAAYASLRDALALFEKAEAVRPAGNDDAILRYNTCVRILERHPDLTEAPREEREPPLE